MSIFSNFTRAQMNINIVGQQVYMDASLRITGVDNIPSFTISHGDDPFDDGQFRSEINTSTCSSLDIHTMTQTLATIELTISELNNMKRRMVSEVEAGGEPEMILKHFREEYPELRIVFQK